MGDREELFMYKRPLARAAVVVATVTALFTGFSAPAALADGPAEFHTPTRRWSTTARSMAALYEGRMVTLIGGWGTAKVCVVNQDRSVDCYRTEDQATAATATQNTTRSYNCSYPLRLYGDI